MIPAGEGKCPCGKTGPLVLDPYGGLPTCEGCYEPPPRGIEGAVATSNILATDEAIRAHGEEDARTALPRGRRRRKSVEHLLALAAADDYRGLYTSLLAALPRCMGECGRASRYVTTYSSEFSCGRAGCERPGHGGDRWMAAPWKDHVDAAEALADRGAR